MKKYLMLVIFFTVLLLGISFNIVFNNRDPKKGDLGVLPSPLPRIVKNSDNGEFAFSYFKISDPSKLYLFTNVDEKIEAKDVKNNQSCKNLANGSFYTKESKLLGLFVREGEVLNKEIKSSLLDGFFSVDYTGEATISRVPPEEEVRISLQSGPMLLENGVYKKLDLKNDEYARRVVVLIDQENTIFFIVFFDKGSKYQGPLLEDLPGILKNTEKLLNTRFKDALNLDGGTASSFYTNEISLKELSPVGSIICEKS